MKTRSLLIALTSAMILAMTNSGMAATEETYFIINDHLGTPQVIENENGTVVWKADYEPYGAATVNEDPDGDGKKVVCNLRFPGQYYDAETGWSYNWHRYYDQELGRYLQADPVGLGMGKNHIYGYAKNSPLSLFDWSGLLVIDTTTCRWNDIEDIEEAERRAENSADCLSVGCNDEIERQFREKHRTARVRCQYEPQNEDWTDSDCASANKSNDLITIYKSSLGGGTDSCPCLANTVFHEVLHLIKDEPSHGGIVSISGACIACE